MTTGTVLPAVDAVSADRLVTLVPALASRIERVMAALALLGHPVRITQARRTDAEQAALYAQGRTTPGAIVTGLNGLTPQTRSYHQSGRAVDFVWRTADGVSYDGPWTLLGACAEAVGLVWGGRFKSGPDRPHLELPAWMGDED